MENGEMMVGFGIRNLSDAQLLARILKEFQQCDGVRISPTGEDCIANPSPYSVMVADHYAGGDPIPPDRIQQLQAYAQGCIDTLRAASGDMGTKPVAK